MSRKHAHPLPEALPRQRAGLLGVIYAIFYVGSAVPSLNAIQAHRIVNLPTTTAVYTILAALVWISTLIAARNPPTASSSY